MNTSNLNFRNHLAITDVGVEKLILRKLAKIHRARMPYKRFSRTGWTFSITEFEAVCAEEGFFNTHRPKHSLSMG